MVLGKKIWTWRRVSGEDTLNTKMCMTISQLLLSHVYQQSEVLKEISTYNGVLHLSNDKNPR